MRALALGLALLAGLAHAQAEPRIARESVIADALTTWAALGAGAAELNPLGYYTVPVRLAAIQYAKGLERDQGLPIIQGITSVSWGAAVNNVLVLAGAGPAAPLVGLGVGFVLWQRGADEREFWRQCAQFRQGHPERACRYSPP